MIRVFTYGMLLPRARQAATLRGWRLAFNQHATIVPDDDGHVLGGIIETDRQGLWGYDGMEGVDPKDPTSEDGYYRRQLVTVELPDGSEVDAWVYVMNAGEGPRPPSAGYVATIHRGYELHGHDVAELELAVARSRGEPATV